jgi:protein-L-isoaspartate(D-aspartate) O-methyltransferase
MKTQIEAAAWVESFQRQLLRSAHELCRLKGVPLSPDMGPVVLRTPRHEFIQRYRLWGETQWQTVTEDSLWRHLPALYRNEGLGIAGRDDEDALATASPPWFVLLMIQLLQVQAGQRILEVGTGSGWSSALLGALVGNEGVVETYEVLPQLAGMAAAALHRLERRNVRVAAKDANDIAETGEPFDRIVLTAGGSDIPAWAFGRLKPGGLVLIPLKCPGGGDVLHLFRRRENHLVSERALLADFVPFTGSAWKGPVLLQEYGPWASVKSALVGSRPLFFGGRGGEDFVQRTLPFRTYLSAVEPRLVWFRAPEGVPFFYFGLWDEVHASLALVREGEVRTYGSAFAGELLFEHLARWFQLGMPSAENMAIDAYRNGHAPRSTGPLAVQRLGTAELVWRIPPTVPSAAS